VDTDKLKLVAAALVVVASLVAYYWWPESSQLLRTIGILAALGIGGFIALQTAQGQEAWTFAIGARNEVRKVIWPTRKETMQGTLVVIIFVILIGFYIWILDTLSVWAVYDLILGVSE